MNQIRKELTDPLNREFSKYLYKYGKRRIDFYCTVKGFYAWYYSDDRVLDNIQGYEKYKGTRRDSHKRERSFDERVSIERSTGERYAFYLLDDGQINSFVSKVRELLEAGN